MVRLVCSDIDGTLLRYGEREISAEIFSLIDSLYDKGILFVPASGRQFSSLHRMFAPAAEHCVFLCQNGGTIFDSSGNVLDKTPIPQQAVREIAEDFLGNSDGIGEITLGSEKVTYLLPRGESVLAEIMSFDNNCRIIRSLDEIEGDIMKISLFVDGKSAEYAGRFVSKWKQYNAAIAGPSWIDCTLANKGTGIHSLCRIFHIQPSEVAAFGDNYNDIPMLDEVGYPYIMDTAVPELLARYQSHTDSPARVIRDIISSCP